ncbi:MULTISPECIES: mismatch-specific DNA-glycosylase [Methanocalculus]|uniref:mismatch-specific DNA-glycosylase n=1 Tax=Methanocalculus TaxID=71151 RepID=UPI00209E0FAE|nr:MULTISPECIES: mismatch-specific DNA-glycosylase [unclassified Methanocalculus]MCP1662328.1 TDG/mug DNA glycosylase family protein [Methanocalculus sp. AMF5]
MYILEDILAHNQLIVFCGSAASRKSAERGCYYCGPGNKFWPQFSRITGRENVMPASIDDCRIVLEYGIGLTDLNKTESGSDRSLTKAKYETDNCIQKMLEYKPRFIVFNGKEAARHALKKRDVRYGLQTIMIGESAVFVAPSTSGLAAKDWKTHGEEYWNRIGGIYTEIKAREGQERKSQNY